MTRPRTSRFLLALCVISPMGVLLAAVAVFVLIDDEEEIPELDDPTTLLVRVKKEGPCLIQGRQYCDFSRPDAQGDYLQRLEVLFVARRQSWLPDFVDYPVVIEAHPETPFGYVQTLLSTARLYGSVRHVTLMVAGYDRPVRFDFARWAKEDAAVRIRLRLEGESCRVAVGRTEIGVLCGGPDDRSVLERTTAEILRRRPVRVVVDPDEAVLTWDVLRLVETLAGSGMAGIDVEHNRLVFRRLYGDDPTRIDD